MAAQRSQTVQVGKRKIELSNLTKVLFPSDHIVKAHLIEYYFKLAPTILAHLKGRALSLVRYPDGIGGESFYQKNRPGWAPDWIEHVRLGDEAKDYVVATEEASLVWLANLACIELHQMHSRAPHFDRPDYIVYDFDPPENFRFANVAELATRFKEHVEKFGYHAFVKTTGRKGLHVIVPIEPKWDFAKAFEAAKVVAQPFVEAHPSALTLQIKKDLRKGKVLLDIYRNRPAQTIVAAYSVRGLPGAPVATPLHWHELEMLETAGVFDLHTVPNRIIQNGDPWEAIAAYAAPIHTERPVVRPTRKDLKPGRTYKTPEQLREYAKKRRFENTPEPAPAPPNSSRHSPGPKSSEQSSPRPTVTARGRPKVLPAKTPPLTHGNSFVVHRHHASRLHYDLRLEQNGVLKSWAIPKGMPPRPGIMRLAVSVEDHPIDYVHFEGAIPKGEYGGGMMWVFARGRYEITKQKRDGFYFRLQSPELNAEYRTHRTRDNQWLLERVDHPQKDWLSSPIEPMLARPANKLPDSTDYVYEVKWDGIRALITLDEGQIRIRGRNGIDLTKQFPELLVADQAFRATSGVFDGEIVCLEPDGKPHFKNVIHRMQQRAEGAIERARAKHPATCYLFDCLYLDGRPIINEPLVRRREWLNDVIRTGSPYRVSQLVEEGPAFFEAVRQIGLEGVMAKLRNSPYTPGTRSEFWLKIKQRQSLECVIIGYTRGKGDRERSFGALHLGRAEGGQLKYVGKVGTGFDDDSINRVLDQLSNLPSVKRPVREKPADSARTVWVQPKLVCEVQFASITPDGMLREPVFLRLRPDLSRTH